MYIFKYFIPAAVWLSGVCTWNSILHLHSQASKRQKGGHQLSGMVQLWKGGSLDTIFSGPLQSKCDICAWMSPHPVPHIPSLRQSRWPCPSCPIPLNTFPLPVLSLMGCSHHELVVSSNHLIPLPLPLPHGETNTWVWFFLCPSDLFENFLSQGAFLSHFSYRQPWQMCPFSGHQNKQGLGGVGGKEGDLAPASWTTSGFYYFPV